ncbi:hypothetical protein IQ258_29680, partial [Coleofasciculus sp. LEGE 07081]
MHSCYQAEIELRENTIAALQEKLKGEFLKIKRPNPKDGFAAWVAQLLMDALEAHEVFCILRSYQKIPGVRAVSIWLDIELGVSAKKLESLAKEVGSHVKLGTPSITWDSDECLYEFHFAPNVDDEEELYAAIDDDGKEVKISEPDDPDWFRRAVRTSYS